MLPYDNHFDIHIQNSCKLVAKSLIKGQVIYTGQSDLAEYDDKTFSKPLMRRTNVDEIAIVIIVDETITYVLTSTDKCGWVSNYMIYAMNSIV